MLLRTYARGTDFDLVERSLRRVRRGGAAAALFERFKQRFGVEILDGIGSTEILHIFISNRPAIFARIERQVVEGYEARIVDDEEADCPRGEIGNLLISGDSTCACYWNKHEKTKATIEGRGFARATSTTRTRMAISGTPGVRTTC
jgi:benzoate-CoA ligase